MSLPNVLCISGHDPSGGAGIQADIEAVAAQGCHSAGVLTALTCQDTRNAYSVTPVNDEEFGRQLHTLTADMPFAAVKTGLLGSVLQVGHIATFAQQHAHTPLVVDPVLKAGGGATLAQDSIAQAILDTLLPHTTVLTPNAAEARHLCPGAASLQACGTTLAQTARWVLITGGDEPSPKVINTLYNADGVVQSYEWPRLHPHYHGSGCTLAAALAARLALGENVRDAVTHAQEYTWAALNHGFKPGTSELGQHIPNRLNSPR